MATLNFQSAAALHRLPLPMVARPGLSRRLPAALRQWAVRPIINLSGRLALMDVSEAIEIPAPIWPVLPAAVPSGLPPLQDDPSPDVGSPDTGEGDTRGWHDSTFALQQGLDVAEGLPVDVPAGMPLGDWLQAYLA